MKKILINTNSTTISSMSHKICVFQNKKKTMFLDTSTSQRLDASCCSGSRLVQLPRCCGHRKFQQVKAAAVKVRSSQAAGSLYEESVPPHLLPPSPPPFSPSLPPPAPLQQNTFYTRQFKKAPPAGAGIELLLFSLGV